MNKNQIVSTAFFLHTVQATSLLVVTPSRVLSSAGVSMLCSGMSPRVATSDLSVTILLNSSMSKISNHGWSKVFISSKVNGENVASLLSISISVKLGGGMSIKLLMLGRITVFSNAAKNINQYFLQVIK